MDGDLDVQPLVAVDDVIAAAAHDRVAAIAAEDDFAGAEDVRIDGERVELCLGQAQDFAQASDARYALLGEEAAAVAFAAALVERQPLLGNDVRAGQQVVVARAGQALDRFVGVLRAELGGWGFSSNTMPRVKSASTVKVLSL
jgi:hypothetical protein